MPLAAGDPRSPVKHVWRVHVQRWGRQGEGSSSSSSNGSNGGGGGNGDGKYAGTSGGGSGGSGSGSGRTAGSGGGSGGESGGRESGRRLWSPRGPPSPVVPTRWPRPATTAATTATTTAGPDAATDAAARPPTTTGAHSFGVHGAACSDLVVTGAAAAWAAATAAGLTSETRALERHRTRRPFPRGRSSGNDSGSSVSSGSSGSSSSSSSSSAVGSSGDREGLLFCNEATADATSWQAAATVVSDDDAEEEKDEDDEDEAWPVPSGAAFVTVTVEGDRFLHHMVSTRCHRAPIAAFALFIVRCQLSPNTWHDSIVVRV